METKIQTLQKKLDDLRARYQKLGDTIMRTHKQIEKLRTKQEEQNIKEDDYEYLLNNVSDETPFKWKMCNQSLEKLGLRTNGYFSETNQKCVSFYLNGSNLEQVYTGLGTIIPFLYPVHEDYIVIDFMEPTLSEFGYYRLKIKGQQHIITKTTYGRESDVASFISLRAALNYIQDNFKMDY